MASKTVKASPYTTITLTPIAGRFLADFRRMVSWLAPKDKDRAGGTHGLRWLEEQFTFTDLDGTRRVMRSYGWFAFARDGQFVDDKRKGRKRQIAPLMIDYFLIERLYKIERGMIDKKGNDARVLQLLAQAVTMMRDRK